MMTTRSAMIAREIGVSERDRLRREVRDACERSAQGVDLLISAFVGALRSYRRASVCTPFPSFLMDDARNKNFNFATDLVTHFPPTREMATGGLDAGAALSTINELPSSALLLLHWILQFRYRVRICENSGQISDLGLIDVLGAPSKYETNIHSAAQAAERSSRPSYIMEIQDSAAEEGKSGATRRAFEAAKSQHGSVMAFHGTSAESLHSILRCGLLNMSKTPLQRNGAMFGEGVYLSTDLGVALSFCKPCDSWEKSSFGSRVRYVLLCEVAKGQGVATSFSETDGSRRATQKRGTYIIVANSDLIRIRHVLVYRDYSRHDFQHRDRAANAAEVNHAPSSANQASWVESVAAKACTLDWSSYAILLYVCLLILVGISKSRVKFTKFSDKAMKQLLFVADRVKFWMESLTNTTS